MENRAAQNSSFADSFVAQVAELGSTSVTEPLSAFLDRCMAAPDLRKSVKDSLPALLADIAHFLNVSHGRLPGIVDHAAQKITDAEAREWLDDAASGFATERSYLNKLTVAAGPIRRHLNQDKVETLLTTQHRSFEMLAMSDRKGCPAGAVMAFTLDWHNTRPLIDRAAMMLAVDVQRCMLPTQNQTLSLANRLSGQAAVERAMTFGCQQVLAQQKGLWHLIAARHHAMTAL